MRITLNELRRVVRRSLAEDYRSQTIPAEMSSDEHDLDAAFPTGWRHGSSRSMKAATPVSVKQQRVTKALTRMGYGIDDAAEKKRITQELTPWLEELEPNWLLVATDDELADLFAYEVLRNG